MYLRYVYFEIKRALGILLSSLLYILLSGLLLAIVSITLIRISEERQSRELFTVSVYISGDERYTKLGTGIVENMDSVKSLCRFNYEQAEADVKFNVESGEAIAGIVLPRDFAKNLYTGESTAIKMYYPENMETPELLFGEILRNSMDMLRISEAGVMTMWDISKKYPLNISNEQNKGAGLLGMVVDPSNVGDYTALLYSDMVFKREHMYDNFVLSPFGNMSAKTYYSSIGIFVLLLMYGVNFSGLYQKRSKALYDCMSIYGIKGFFRELARVISLWVVLLVIIISIYLILFAFGMGYMVAKLIIFIPVTLVMAVYFHSIMSLSGNGPQGSINVFIANIVLMAIYLIVIL